MNRLRYFALKDVNVCKRLVDHLVTKTSDCIILPFSDNPLTDELLSRNNYGSLTICERDNKARAKLESRAESMLCKPNVNVYTDDLFDLSYKIQDDEAQTRFSEVVQSGRLSAEKTSGCSCRGSSVKLVWPLIQGKYESSTLRNIYYQAALRLGPYSDTFVDYYLLLSDRLYSNLSAKPGGNLVNYRGLHRIQSTAKSNNSLYENVHWVRWEPNVERINEVGPNFMIEYKFFVHQIMSKRTALVMPSVENWFRGCRRDLYEIGLTDKTTVGQVNVEQFFKLFKYLRSRPDYESSPLRQVIAMTETTSFSSSTDGYKGQVVSPSSLTYI